MKSNPKLAFLLAFMIVVLLVSSSFVSRHIAGVHANRLMTPAIKNGWTHYNTRLQFLPGRGLVPGWRVGYELENSFTNPLAVYVDFRGRVDDWEVREVLASYKDKQNAGGQSAKPSESN